MTRKKRKTQQPNAANATVEQRAASASAGKNKKLTPEELTKRLQKDPRVAQEIEEFEQRRGA